MSQRSISDKDELGIRNLDMVAVVFEDQDYRLVDNLTPETVKELKDRDLLKDFYINGDFVFTNTFEEIRNTLKAESNRVYGK